jgi:3'(2'), 5'-bisphosphate nucleotidase
LPSYADDLIFARDLARRTGEMLVPLRARIGFADRWRLELAGDRAAQNFIAAELAKHRPHDAVLSEEAPDNKARLLATRVWIIDPIDGTSSFSSEGRTEWAVQG